MTIGHSHQGQDAASPRRSFVPQSPSASGADSAAERPLLRVVKGHPTDEEVAALVAVVQAAAAGTAAEPPAGPRSEWAAAHRRLRTTFPAGPGGWRASSLPR